MPDSRFAMRLREERRHRSPSARVAAAVCLTLAATIAAGPSGASQAARSWIVVLREGPARRAVPARAPAVKAVRHVYRHAVRGFAATLTPAEAEALSRSGDVLMVAPDRRFALAGQTMPTGVGRIAADESSAASGDGMGASGAAIAVVDTGVDTDHPDLSVAGGVDCTGGGSFDDRHGHGTRVAGVAAARDDAFGVVGVAPGAPVLAVRVVGDDGTASLSDLLCGIDWITATRTDADPSNDVAVANVSLAGRGSDDGDCGHTQADPLHAAICGSVAAGVSYVVAAGNDADDLATTAPAAYDEVITVTAASDLDGRPGGTGGDDCTGERRFADDTAAPFSNFAVSAADALHTVAAPGVCITSTVPVEIDDTMLRTGSGTSLAAPHVAGLVSLCIGSGACRGLPAPAVAARVWSGALADNLARPAHGFARDPLRDPTDVYYGFLVHAAAY